MLLYETFCHDKLLETSNLRNWSLSFSHNLKNPQYFIIFEILLDNLPIKLFLQIRGQINDKCGNVNDNK